MRDINFLDSKKKKIRGKSFAKNGMKKNPIIGPPLSVRDNDHLIIEGILQ